MVEHPRTLARLELIHPPTLGCVVFRYRPERSDLDADTINARVRRDLFHEGVAVLGQIRVRGRTCLKLTLLNPAVGEPSIAGLLEAIVARGAALEERMRG